MSGRNARESKLPCSLEREIVHTFEKEQLNIQFKDTEKDVNGAIR